MYKDLKAYIFFNVLDEDGPYDIVLYVVKHYKWPHIKSIFLKYVIFLNVTVLKFI